MGDWGKQLFNRKITSLQMFWSYCYCLTPKIKRFLYFLLTEFPIPLVFCIEREDSQKNNLHFPGWFKSFIAESKSKNPMTTLTWWVGTWLQRLEFTGKKHNLAQAAWPVQLRKLKADLTSTPHFMGYFLLFQREVGLVLLHKGKHFWDLKRL